MTPDYKTDQLLHEEYRALKSEMLLRIAIQNTAIFGAVFLFALAVSLLISQPQNAQKIALMQTIATFALALQWCHQGVRQCALKLAVLDRDAAAGRQESWESWLPSQRPASLLGSRWFISTKAVFIGLSGVTILFAWSEQNVFSYSAIGVWILLVLSLLTNPKE